MVNRMKKLFCLLVLLLFMSGCTLFCDKQELFYQTTNTDLTFSAQLITDQCGNDQLKISDIQYKSDPLVTEVNLVLYYEDEVVSTLESDSYESDYEGKVDDEYRPIFSLTEYLTGKQLVTQKREINPDTVSSYRLEMKFISSSLEEIELETSFEKVEK